jgi:hypothetical protein
MVSLSWKKLIPKLEVLDTQKKYFSRYLYKLELLTYGARSINSTADIAHAIQQRINSYRQVNYGGSWQAHTNWQLQQADYEWLEYLKQQKFNLADGLKLRIEEPKVQIYSETEDALVQFIRRIPSQFRQYGIAVYRPANDEQLELLEAGIKIVKTPPKYRFKISFRDGKYAPETKQQILNYLTALEDQVKLPTRCRDQLEKTDFGYVWDCVVYTNDVNITTFIRIINPALVRSITEMVSVAQINTDSEEI